MKLNDDIKHHMLEWLKLYTQAHCVVRKGPNGPNIFAKDNSEYIWQVYLRRGLFNRKFITYVGHLFWDRYAERFNKQPFQIAGLETGSTPLITGLLMTSGLHNIDVNCFSIRAKRKNYGLFNNFEGVVLPDIPVMLVDDFCNSKNTLWTAYTICKNENLFIYDTAFTVGNKNINETDSKNFDKHIGDKLKVESLVYINELKMTYTSYQLEEFRLKEKYPNFEWEISEGNNSRSWYKYF